ncbi:unnamed protein product [Cylindrotheca closterium]|uniref:Uncharacterized protein n=1 Tax=Cylindrotheca closterium TaxID=2856 RepID=A0AAD2CE56_9STRA|nr:unnamed protein product [Cylindrotheca closterium]
MERNPSRWHRHPMSICSSGMTLQIPTGLCSSGIVNIGNRKKNRTCHQQMTGQNTIEHIKTMFPLFWREKELLKLIREEQREYQKFEIGDIVMVRKQVQSNASAGIPAKLVLQTKGPCRVIEKAS